MTEINPIMVQTLAKMTGKTEEEVLKFLEKKDSVEQGTQVSKGLEQAQVDISKSQQVNAPQVDTEAVKRVVENMKASAKLINTMPTARELENAKSKDPEPKVVQDEVITEEVPLDQLTEQQLQEAEEENNTFSDSIRVGSKVRVTWEPNVGKGKIKWVGKVGTVLQKLSDSGVSVYLVEFPAGKIPFQRVNKKTGKLEKGYHTKKLQQWLDENNIELVF